MSLKIGTVNRSNSTKGYEFIGPEDDEEDVFIHFLTSEWMIINN